MKTKNRLLFVVVGLLLNTGCQTTHERLSEKDELSNTKATIRGLTVIKERTLILIEKVKTESRQIKELKQKNSFSPKMIKIDKSFHHSINTEAERIIDTLDKITEASDKRIIELEKIIYSDDFIQQNSKFTSHKGKANLIKTHIEKIK